MRSVLRGAALLALVLLLVPSGFAKSPARANTEDDSKNADDTTTTTPADTKADDAAATTVPDTSNDETAAPEAGSATSPALPAQTPASNGKGNDQMAAPTFIPMLATTGTIGLFTVETADTLPKGGFAFSAYGNKFGRMPGSVTIFQLGVDLSYGITDRLNFYASFDPYGHMHIGDGSQLSLAPQNNGGVPYPNTIFHTLPNGTPGYVEDFPLAANDSGGLGNITLGLKYGLLSERHGAPVSLSIRNDLIISPYTSLRRLLGNGTVASPISDLISGAVSKQWSNVITVTFNAGFEFIRNPRDYDGNLLFQMGNQAQMGAGLILFPESRFQPMTEYTAVVFQGTVTPDTTFGARDPVDGVWGLRAYLWNNVALDAGYRYMLNLRDLNDRSGFVVKVGTAYWPKKTPPPNHPPTASCSTDKSVVYLGSGDTVAVTATASDPDNDPLTYTWSATGGSIDGNGAQVRWRSTGTTAGTYTVTVKVDDGRGGSVSCSSEIQVEPRPNHPPTISCSANPSSVFAGERSTITCNASDPDGDPLSYTWRANGGQITGNGPTGIFDTTGLSPGTYTITTRVDDGRGGAADASVNVEVKPVPPPPQASKINECAFGRPLSTRVDNVCKRILDDVALRLQNEPRASAVIIGYSDPKERRPEKIAGDRAANAVKYLGEKGIDASRVTTRTGSGQAGATNNRRIDIIYVPEGATY